MIDEYIFFVLSACANVETVTLCEGLRLGGFCLFFRKNYPNWAGSCSRVILSEEAYIRIRLPVTLSSNQEYF